MKVYNTHRTSSIDCSSRMIPILIPSTTILNTQNNIIKKVVKSEINKIIEHFNEFIKLALKQKTSLVQA